MKFIDISTEPRRIVGIVADLDDETIGPPPNMTVYHPFEQEAAWIGRFVRPRSKRSVRASSFHHAHDPRVGR
jgi:hypothetical protein